MHAQGRGGSQPVVSAGQPQCLPRLWTIPPSAFLSPAMQFLQVSLKVHGEGPQALLLPKAVGRVPGSVPPLGLCQEPRAPWPLGPDVPCPPLLEAGVGWRGWGDS